MARLQMQNMPRHDPVPQRPLPSEAATTAWARFRQLMKWMAAASVLAAVAAVAFLRALGDEFGLWATLGIGLGVALSIMLGTALMGLVFVSNRGGHDEAARGGERDER